MLKKIITVGFLFLILSMTKVASAYSWSYSWTDTYVPVRINDSIYNYTEIPKAYLYRDGVKLNNVNIVYNRNGDWLHYLKDVDTNTPGDYQVWYKAYEDNYNPGTCENYKALITFHVYDDIKPKINLIQDRLSIAINSDPKKIDFNSYFNIIDNLKNDTKVTINYDLIDFKKKGSYDLTISAVDSEGNSDFAVIKVEIVDGEGPVVNFLGENNKLVLEKGKEVNLKDYFKAIDAVDGNVLDSMKVEGFNALEIGLYKNVKFTFSDSALNESYYYLDIELVDLIFPTLSLNEQQISLQYETNFTDELFKKYINEANDNGKDLFSEVQIDYTSLQNKVGNYEVIYSLKDEDGNLTEARLKVNLVSLVKPTITCENVKIKVGEEVDFTKYFKVIDSSDPNALATAKIDLGSFDNLTPGIYYVTVTANNSSGLFSHGIIEVEVVRRDSNNFFTTERIIILVMLISLLLGGLIYYLIRLKKKKAFLEEE